MPGPFPGMDPYLEHPVLWPGFHHQFIACARGARNAILPAPYAADSGERVYVVPPGRSIYPDALVIEHTPVRSSRKQGGRGTAARSSEAPWRIVAEPEQIREPFIEILALENGRRVVTIIEVLSPANKAAGSEGRALYLQKRQEVLASPVHLVEIDLLLGGEHTVAPPREKLREHGRWNHLVSLHRAGTTWTFEVWPNLLRERLPVIRVPLADGDPDIELDLQPILDRAYDEGAYRRLVDYHRDPPVPLPEEDARWADTLLREKGLR